MDIDSMASLVSSLSSSFQQVPPAAIPAMLDCILATTGSSRLVLFESFLDALAKQLKHFTGDNKFDTERQKYLVSMVAALCHLLKKLGTNYDALQSFMWRCFIPLMKTVHPLSREVLNQAVESFVDVVCKTSAWEVIAATFLPFLRRSIALSAGWGQNKESGLGEDTIYVSQGSESWRNNFNVEKECMLSLCASFPMPTSCHLLASVLDAAVQNLKASLVRTESMLGHEHGYLEKMLCSLLLDMCNMAEQLLSQSFEIRSCTIRFLLPCILRAFTSRFNFEIQVNDQTRVLSWNCFFQKIWKCCLSLFSLGPSERRDAYRVLSLCITSCLEECETSDTKNKVEEFDIRAEQEFWFEIKRGLVDEEGLVRKQSLDILKKVLYMNEGRQTNCGVLEIDFKDKLSAPCGMTRREAWADKEAKSLGVGKFCNLADSSLHNQQQWQSFILLFEMLEEYGTHLVEAAWNHQLTSMLQSSNSCNSNFPSSNGGGVLQYPMESLSEIFRWLVVLWERGFCHDNPHVRCLIMQSFLEIEWKKYGIYATSIPETFVLDPFVKALDDPIHHKDFGVKGIYSSRTIEGTTHFLHTYASSLSRCERASFLYKLGSVTKQHSFGRAGLMALSNCIASVACGTITSYNSENQGPDDMFHHQLHEELTNKSDLLDVLRFVIESSKQHFNPNYRLGVCEKITCAVASAVCAFAVPLEILLHFISALPREFTDYNCTLRIKLQEWLLGCGQNDCSAHCRINEFQLLKSFQDFPARFSSCHQGTSDNFFDDEELDAWEFESTRWARALFLVVKEDHELVPILSFIEHHGIGIDKQYNNRSRLVSVKFLLLTISLVSEIQILQEPAAERGTRNETMADIGSTKVVASHDACTTKKKFRKLFCIILRQLVSLADSCSILWSHNVEDATLSGSIRGKLGGYSQRRLSSSTTTSVLQAITSIKAIASVLTWLAKFTNDGTIDFAFTFLWSFFWNTISSPASESETGAEICLAAYQALTYVLRALVSASSMLTLDLIRKSENKLQPSMEDKPWLDCLVLSFLQNVNKHLSSRALARTRRAILLNLKWLCLEYLLSLPCYAIEKGLHAEDSSFFFSYGALKCIFSDLVESLENAGESSVLPMMRSVRLVTTFFASRRSSKCVTLGSDVDIQMSWHLVRSCWTLHVSCNKRRIACIAALLSSVLHPSVFGDECMHSANDAPGPLKWFIENLIEEGMKSPRTVRLSALHLTGLWLFQPRTIKYYIRELRLLTLYGSVAFDEDFKGELADNLDARVEVSLLATSPDLELTETFINTELYARVSVAVLFNKLGDLADIVGSGHENEDCHAALESGKLFLLELLDSVVNDNNLAKELYKKYSAVHRHKIRVWQMICVLSRFVRHDIIEQVTHRLHTCLYRNNLPAVRQYLETFAINVYLKFPLLVKEQLVPILRNYDMRPQALSSYVFIAANIILHTSKDVRPMHLEELLPPLVPLLTSHHHSLRGFTQLLVHRVLSQNFCSLDYEPSVAVPLEMMCFKDLKLYLEKNSDCMRLRASMEGFLDAYDPILSVTPAGIFINRVEEVEFECVPTSLMDQVVNFLNDVREDLRSSMARDVVTIKNESLKINDDMNSVDMLSNSHLCKDTVLDFQKKVTVSKEENQGMNSRFILANNGTYKLLEAMEKEDELLGRSLQYRNLATEKSRIRQQIFVVASLLDRIPNLAGLARTCEVFKASGLAIADMSVLRDKQFQLISVTAEKWVPILEIPVNSVKHFLQKKKQEGFSIFGLEQTSNSVPLDQFTFPEKTVLVLGREKEGIPVDIIHVLDACIEIPQLGVVRSLNVHVSGAIALWDYTRQMRSRQLENDMFEFIN